MSDAGDRRRRFERLERARGGPARPGEGPAGEPEAEPGSESPGLEERFQAMDRPEAAPEEAGARTGAAQAARDRFGPAAERPPDVDAAALSSEEQPFLRCARCQTDSSRYASRCTTCGEDLRTEAQRAYNRRLWEARRAERAESERVAHDRQTAQAEAEAATAAARREAYAAMAREVGRMERERLDRGEGRWTGLPGAELDPTPIGVRLLRLLPGTWARLAALAGLGLAIGLGLLIFRSPLAWGGAVALVVILFAPRLRVDSWRW